MCASVGANNLMGVNVIEMGLNAFEMGLNVSPDFGQEVPHQPQAVWLLR